MMDKTKTILITGASGNLGRKLWLYLEEAEADYQLRLLDKTARFPQVMEADLAHWSAEWTQQFDHVDTVVHLAADPNASAPWEKITEPNIDALINVFTAAVQAGVKRVIYASSNHAMGGYKDLAEPEKLTTTIPPKPGTFFANTDGTERNSLAYGAAKYFGERLGKCYHDIHGLSTIAVRIGWNLASNSMPPKERGDWFRQMWLSNRDYCQLMERCIEADPQIGFTVINGMSNNTGMRWDIEHPRELIGYEPQDNITMADS